LIFEKIKDAKGLGKLFNSMGTACWWAGRADEALQWYEKADETNIAVDQPYVLGLTANNRGYVFLEQGDHEKADAEFARARSIRRSLSSAGYEMMDVSGLARAAWMAGRIDDAKSLSREALAGLEGLETLEDLRRVYYNHYEICRDGSASEREEADAAMRKARELVNDRLVRLDDPDLRASFIEGVPLVKEILAST
jgi:tetratricopeptide (TPR) repeat protein